MDTPPQEPLRRLLPLLENGDNEKLANLLAMLLGGTPGAQKLALGILMGIQDFLDHGDIKRVELTWIPPQIFEAARAKHKQDLGAVIAEVQQQKAVRLKCADAHGARIYHAVEQIALKFKEELEKPSTPAGD